MKLLQKFVRRSSLAAPLCLLANLLAVATPAISAQPPSAYTTATRYNATRQVTAIILPWDGGQFQATRNTYDTHGWLISTEKGALSAWQNETIAPSAWTGFTLHLKTVYTYDNLGRKTTQTGVTSAGTPTSLSQYSYDDLNQLTCSAVRMDPREYAYFTQTPVILDACTLSDAPTGSHAYGPDRITHYAYNAVGQITQEKRAYSTPIAQTYITNQYNNYLTSGNSRLTDQTDANGNLSHLDYDAQGRVQNLYFPSKTVAGQYNAGDFEQYGYDANGNRTSLRKRDTTPIAYAYDKLNRLVSETYSSATSTPNVYYGYDLRSLQLYARFGSGAPTSPGITTTYDGFGSVANSTTNQSGANRTLGYQHDLEGQRTRLTHPDNQFFSYTYDGLRRLTTIRENGGTTLIQLDYDNQGRPQTLSRGANISSTTYAYDPASRLASLSQDLAGTAYDESRTFRRNPASQVISRTLSNAVYSFTQVPTVSTAYEVNGLNQYTQLNAGASAPASPSHDANGNMTFDGVTLYYYDPLNRLTGATGGKTVNISYDPKGRLFQTSGGASGTTQFLYDGDALVGEYNAAGTLQRRYVHGAGIDQPLVSYTGTTVSATNRQYLHADQQGSVMAVADTIGNAVQVNTYDPYGVPAVSTSQVTGNTTRFQYTGQIMLPDLGLYHYKARVYNPYLGRFMQTDPIGYNDDMDLYSYVGNDPMDRRDPTGLESVGEMIDQKAMQAAKAGSGLQTYGLAFAGVAWALFGAEGTSQVFDKGSASSGADRFSAALEVTVAVAGPAGKLVGTAAKGLGNQNPLYKAAVDQFKSTELSNAGRALTKHPELIGETKDTLRQALRTDGAINGAAHEALRDIMRNGVTTTPTLGRYGTVTQTQIPGGFGARWASDGSFIGFINP